MMSNVYKDMIRKKVEKEKEKKIVGREDILKKCCYGVDKNFFQKNKKIQ